MKLLRFLLWIIILMTIIGPLIALIILLERTSVSADMILPKCPQLEITISNEKDIPLEILCQFPDSHCTYLARYDAYFWATPLNAPRYGKARRFLTLVSCFGEVL